MPASSGAKGGGVQGPERALRVGLLLRARFGDTAKSVQCPRCQSSMDSLDKSGINIDSCSSCQGFWLDRGELERMIARRATGHPSAVELGAALDHLGNSAPEVREGQLYACPRCNAQLGKIAYQRGDQKVVADKCASCGGVWLDSGEMGLLFALVEEDRHSSGVSGIVIVLVMGVAACVAVFFILLLMGKL